MIKTTRKVAPDGGWGWMACFGVSLVNLATRSIEPSFGLLFGDLLTEMNVGTTGAAIIISALDVSMNLSGLFVGPLLKEFSYRKVALLGSFLCGLGLALTSPAKSMAHILVTYSVINGMGVGLATSAAFVALNHYFAKKRGQAVGLSMAGTAMGMLFLPQLVRILLEVYSFQGAILLLSGLAIHASVGSMLLQPIKWHWKEEEVDVELMEGPVMGTLAEEDDAEDSLPEIKTLLFQNKRERKVSDTLMPPTATFLPKRPTFPRIASSVSVQVNNGGLSKRPTFPRITSTASMSMNMNPTVRKRKVSVISQLSQYDFTGSGLHIHMDTGDQDLADENESPFMRRVNTHVGMMNNLNRESFHRQIHKINSAAGDFTKGSEGIEMAEPVKPTFWRRFITLLDVDLLKDVIYLNILFGLSIFYVAEMNFKMVTPFFLVSLGYNKSDTAAFLSVSALTDILARIIVPPICDKLNVSKRKIFMTSLVFVAVTRSILAEQSGYTNLMVWLCICGFFRGIALSNFTLTVSEYSSLEKLPAAFGWHLIGKALFVVAFGPLIGAIRDLTNSFPICIHTQSVFILMCVLAWLIEFGIVRMRSTRLKAQPLQLDEPIK